MGPIPLVSRRVVVAAVVAGGLCLAAGPSPGEGPVTGNPTLTFSTLLGGSGSDHAGAMAVGPDGVLWIAASSNSIDFLGAERPGAVRADGIVVLRFDPEARAIVSSVWIEDGTPKDIEVDAAGNAFVLAHNSIAFQPDAAGIPAPPAEERNRNAALTRISPDGLTVAWRALLGGGEDEIPTALALATDGDPVVVGWTASPDFPLASPLQPELAGYYDAFVTRVEADGSGLVFSTYLGGADADRAESILALPGGGFLVGGTTESADFPATDRLLGSPVPDEGFLVAIDDGGSAIARAALLGSTHPYHGLAEDGQHLLLSGVTRDTGFPAAPFPDGEDEFAAFLLRLDSGDWSVVDAALYGGPALQFPRALAKGPDGTVWLGGSATRDPGLPVPGGARVLSGGYIEAFLAAFDGEDLSLVYGTYLGGDSSDIGYALAVTDDGAAWFAGYAGNGTFPLVDPLEPVRPVHHDSDVFLCRNLPGDPAARPAAPTNPAVTVLDGNTARLTWEDGSTDETCFGVYRRTGPALPEHPGAEKWGYLRVAVLPAGTAEWTDEGLLSDRRYSWAVQAINDAGGSPPTEIVEADLPATLAVDLDSAVFRFNSRKGTLRIRGTLARTPSPSGDAFNPRESGFEWRFLNASSPIPFVSKLECPAAHRNWSRGTRRIRWTEPGFRFEFRPDTGAFQIRRVVREDDVQSNEIVPMQFTLGADSGFTDPVLFGVGPRRLEMP